MIPRSRASSTASDDGAPTAATSAQPAIFAFCMSSKLARPLTTTPKSVSGTRIAISVTENGFEPKVVAVPAGKPVTLVVTRHTDETCVRDFVMAERNISKPLPLERPVEITFTPEKPGDLTYACAMDMFRGTVRVE